MLIELTDIHKEFSGYGTTVQALRGIDLQIEQGDFIVIVGKSGSGKSTLLSLLGGLDKPTKGSIKFNNLELINLNQNKLAELRLKEIGIVFQQFFLMEGITASDNVELPMILNHMNSSERRTRALELLEMVQLSDRATHYPDELSGGEKQRVAIARALANKPLLLLADEITGKLDSQTGEEIIELLFSINQNVSEEDWKPTIIMVTHDLSLIKEGMKVITLSDGQIAENSI